MLVNSVKAGYLKSKQVMLRFVPLSILIRNYVLITTNYYVLITTRPTSFNSTFSLENTLVIRIRSVGHAR